MSKESPAAASIPVIEKAVRTAVKENRKAGSDEFKEALSRAQRNEQAREALLTDDEARAKRLSGVEFIDGFENFDGYDEKMVSQALQGGSWGDDDQRRYDRMMGKTDDDFGGDIIDDPITDPEPSPVENKIPQPVNVTVSPSYDNDVTFGSPPGTAPGVDGYGGQSLQVAQNNPLTQTVTGDNNVTTAYQDNSISQYGGSNYLNDWMRRHNFFA